MRDGCGFWVYGRRSLYGRLTFTFEADEIGEGEVEFGGLGEEVDLLLGGETEFEAAGLVHGG